MQFETVKREIVSSSSPSAGHDLVGMQIDFEHYLSASELLRNVSVQGVAEEPGTLIAVADFAGPPTEIAKLGEELRSIWLLRLRYNFREAHEIISAPDQTTLRFVTKIDVDGFYVTGSIRVHHAS